MKLFTIDEANEMLPLVRPKLERLRTLYKRMVLLREPARQAASASGSGGGMKGGSVYVQAISEISQITADLDEKGVQLKDHNRGLIDFPCLRNGRVVLLCWQLGEREEIELWHNPEAGFAGRERF